MSELPTSALPRCLICAKPFAPSVLMLHEIEGYERERDAGGTNHVIARKRTGHVVCPTCALRVQRGRVDQETLGI